MEKVLTKLWELYDKEFGIEVRLQILRDIAAIEQLMESAK